MASFVSAADALAAAVEIEKRGHSFYSRAAVAAKDANRVEEAEFFNFMADEEQRHEKIFASMLKRLGGLYVPLGSDQAEYLEYMSGLLDSHQLFTGELGTLYSNPYVIAMQLEKDSIVFFNGLMPLLPAGEQQHVEHCIQEEQKHIRLIARRQAEAKKAE